MTRSLQKLPRINTAYPCGMTYDVNNGSFLNYNYYTPHVRSGAVVISVNHGMINGRYASGGPFAMWKAESKVTLTGNLSVWRTGRFVIYKGGMYCGTRFGFPTYYNGDYNQNMKDKLNALQSEGASAFNRLRPDKPEFDLALALLELKDVPHSLKQATSLVRGKVRAEALRRGKSSLSHTAEWFLAIEFGWLPLLNDIRKFIDAQNSGQKRLKQLIRDNEKSVRRRANAPVNTYNPGYNQLTGKTPYSAYVFPDFVTQCYGSTVYSISSNSTKTEKLWSSARFRYMLPPGPHDVAWTKKMLSRLMNGRITPSVAYNLIPWSWLVDYFTNLGDFFDAISPGVADNLVYDYLYVMRQQDVTHVTIGTESLAGSKDGKLSLNATSTRTDTWTHKFRAVGSPFGFGIRSTDLNVKQTAILGALGLSRL